MGPWRCLLLLPLLAAAPRAQQQQFMEYVERRLVMLEVRAGGAGRCGTGMRARGAEPTVTPRPQQERIAQWHDQSSRYSTELRDFKNQVLGMLETAEKEREALRTEAESAAARVDRLEREVDYLETQNPAPPCVEVDEVLTEKQAATAKQRKNEKYSKVTGEGRRAAPGGGVGLADCPELRLRSCIPGRAAAGGRGGGSPHRGFCVPLGRQRC